MDRTRFEEFLSFRIERLAPNLQALVGSDIAAMLIGAAGGCEKLAKLTPSAIASLGVEKGSLGGYSVMQQAQAGYIWKADIIQNSPEAFRRKVCRKVCSKGALCIRLDAKLSVSELDAYVPTFGLQCRAHVLDNIDKLLQPDLVKQVQPLKPPDRPRKRHRAGRKIQSEKKQTAQSQDDRLRKRIHLKS